MGYRTGILTGVLAALAACGPIDTGDSVRASAGRWVFVERVDRMVSSRDCTVARLTLEVPDLQTEGGAVRVSSVKAALPLLDERRAVIFAVPNISPNTVSERLMNANLFKGLGLVASVVGPSRRCMDDAVAAETYAALMSERVIMVFDPATYTVLLVDPVARLAHFMRVPG